MGVSMSIETPRGTPNIPQISPVTVTDRGTIPKKPNAKPLRLCGFAALR
jgi:hypothetical protein